MDYECGAGPFDGDYWKAVEVGPKPEWWRKPHPPWQVLLERLRPGESQRQ